MFLPGVLMISSFAQKAVHPPLQRGTHGFAPVSYTHLDVYKRQELGGPATLLACGGAAGLIVPYCRHKIRNVPTLILDGLYAVYRAVNP